jgi:predicted RND superfamily exporter protein
MLPLPAVLLGLAVDDTFHLLWPLRGRGRPTRLTLARSAMRTGPPVLATTAVLALSVATLAFSGLAPNRELGLLLAGGLVAALACDLTLIPAALATTSRCRSARRSR